MAREKIECPDCGVMVSKSGLGNHKGSKTCLNNQKNGIREKGKCPHCGIDTSDMDNSVAANHVRWCEKNPKRNDGSNIRLDSKWESKLADRLTDIGLKWERSSGPEHGFEWIDKKGTKRTYNPDFYLPDFDVYLDIKNDYIKNVKQKSKVDYVLEKYKNIRIFNLDEMEDILGLFYID